ncbi:hypothetical protein EYF80_015420 [Liparis tanakae]|uniref:Uncharacterized protein n=1 Tax=Liparis tanakae TaxID=230148 RepID=A0A4Z2I8N1_9TELE|nr:hypothetical protein EYF80_015420 [Liparis tanakae]
MKPTGMKPRAACVSREFFWEETSETFSNRRFLKHALFLIPPLTGGVWKFGCETPRKHKKELPGSNPAVPPEAQEDTWRRSGRVAARRGRHPGARCRRSAASSSCWHDVVAVSHYAPRGDAAASAWPTVHCAPRRASHAAGSPSQVDTFSVANDWNTKFKRGRQVSGALPPGVRQRRCFECQRRTVCHFCWNSDQLEVMGGECGATWLLLPSAPTRSGQEEYFTRENFRQRWSPTSFIWRST